MGQIIFASCVSNTNVAHVRAFDELRLTTPSPLRLCVKMEHQIRGLYARPIRTLALDHIPKEFGITVGNARDWRDQ